MNACWSLSCAENIQECNGGKKQRNEVVPAHSTSQNPQEDDGDSVQIVAEDMQDCIECLEDTASTTPSPKIGTWSTIYPDVVPLSEGTLGPLPMVTMDDFACFNRMAATIPAQCLWIHHFWCLEIILMWSWMRKLALHGKSSAK